LLHKIRFIYGEIFEYDFYAHAVGICKKVKNSKADTLFRGANMFFWTLRPTEIGGWGGGVIRPTKFLDITFFLSAL